jgi:hypothetical protein
VNRNSLSEGAYPHNYQKVRDTASPPDQSAGGSASSLSPEAGLIVPCCRPDFGVIWLAVTPFASAWL